MKRLTFITGHYGSGKSEVALNLAIQKKFDYLVDLDIINPYFRSRELSSRLLSKGIKVISSPVYNSLGSDLPYISSESFIPFLDQKITAIYDFGGAEIGLRLVHQFKDYLKPNEVSVLFCVNIFREETKNSERIIQMINSFERESNLVISGLINNSNLLHLTTCQDIYKSQKIVQEVSKQLDIPVLYTTGVKQIISKCNNLMGEVIPLELYLRKEWM